MTDEKRLAEMPQPMFVKLVKVILEWEDSDDLASDLAATVFKIITAESLRASQQGGIAEEWKLVPVEATPEIEAAIRIAAWRSGSGVEPASVYKAMLKASPPPPVSDGRNAIIEECAAGIENLVGTSESMLEAAASIRALKSTKPGADGDMA